MYKGRVCPKGVAALSTADNLSPDESFGPGGGNKREKYRRFHNPPPFPQLTPSPFPPSSLSSAIDSTCSGVAGGEGREAAAAAESGVRTARCNGGGPRTRPPRPF